MRSRIVVALALAALAGCRVEGGKQAAAAADSAARAAGPAMPGLGHTVFNRRREVVAPGLARVTVSAIVRLDAGQDSARRVMENLLAEERRTDTTVAAIRVLGYLPPPQGHGAAGRTMLVPLVFTDWAPEPGFDSLGTATRGRPYRTTTRFVHDAAMLRGMGTPEHPGGATPQLPRGTMPRGGPAPRRP
jgi:hypothetical protein